MAVSPYNQHRQPRFPHAPLSRSVIGRATEFGLVTVAVTISGRYEGTLVSNDYCNTFVLELTVSPPQRWKRAALNRDGNRDARTGGGCSYRYRTQRPHR